jgi:hypothetical protein
MMLTFHDHWSGTTHRHFQLGEEKPGGSIDVDWGHFKQGFYVTD